MSDDPLNKEEDDVPRASGYHAFADPLGEEPKA
jgi:hypothetical protein